MRYSEKRNHCISYGISKIRPVFRIALLTLIILLASICAFIRQYIAFGGSVSKADWEEYGKRAENFKNGVFQQLFPAKLMTGEKSHFDRTRLKPEDEIPVIQLSEIPNASEDQLKWIWLGHSSSLLQIGGKNILIDPMFSDYASPIQGVGPKRFSKLPITLENMPQIDVMVISHDHYDHLDYDTIRNVDDKVKEYVVPLGVEKHLIRWGVDPSRIHNMAWWEDFEIGNIKITATPGQHFTNRLPWRSNTTLWCGYAFQANGKTVYFSGDTGYGQFFKDIRERIGDVDLLLLECGQYDQSWGQIHSFPEQGIEIIKDVNADWTIPVHWATFCICNHAWNDSIIKISRYAKEQGRNLATPKIGQTIQWDEIGEYQEHWWEEVR